MWDLGHQIKLFNLGEKLLYLLNHLAGSELSFDSTFIHRLNNVGNYVPFILQSKLDFFRVKGECDYLVERTRSMF